MHHWDSLLDRTREGHRWDPSKEALRISAIFRGWQLWSILARFLHEKRWISYWSKLQWEDDRTDPWKDHRLIGRISRDIPIWSWKSMSSVNTHDCLLSWKLSLYSKSLVPKWELWPLLKTALDQHSLPGRDTLLFLACLQPGGALGGRSTSRVCLLLLWLGPGCLVRLAPSGGLSWQVGWFEPRLLFSFGLRP